MRTIYHRSLILCIVLITHEPRLRALISLVYNLRIAETTRRAARPLFSMATSQLGIGDSVFSFVAVEQRRVRYNGFKSHTTGLLASYLYAPVGTDPNSASSWYGRVSTAVGNVTECEFASVFANPHRTQLDDILFSAGYTHVATDACAITATGHLGVPTHRDCSIFRPQFGVGHPALGGQLDAAYTYTHHEGGNSTFLGAIRYLHFFPRSAYGRVPTAVTSGCWKIFPGDEVDFFIAHNTQRGPWAYEFGYNPTFFLNIKSEPRLSGDPGDKIIRSSFYGVIIHLFPLKHHISGFNIGLSYSFDHIPQTVGLKRSLTAWFTWGINF